MAATPIHVATGQAADRRGLDPPQVLNLVDGRAARAEVMARRGLAVAAMACLAALVGGCGRHRPPPAVRITYTLPGGPTATEVDATLGQPLLRAAARAPGLTHLAVVSTTATADLYAVGRPGVDPTDLARDVVVALTEAGPLPPGAAIAAVSHLPPGSAVPTPTAATASHIVVDLDPAKLAAAGLAIADVTATMDARRRGPAGPPPGSSVEDLKAVVIRAADGRQARLGDVAHIKDHPQVATVRRDLF